LAEEGIAAEIMEKELAPLQNVPRGRCGVVEIYIPPCDIQQRRRSRRPDADVAAGILGYNRINTVITPSELQKPVRG
jgi:hypothetical protein